MSKSIFLATLFIVASVTQLKAAESLRMGVFDVDVSPPIGTPLAYNRCDSVAMSLRATGIVLLGSGDPIVLCAVDWIGIANASHKEWRRRIANAVGTSPERVTVHTLHQHDAPQCDFSADAILAEHGLGGTIIDMEFAKKSITNVASRVKEAVTKARVVTHLGLGKATVKKVASNRRILGDDGKVRATRYTACKDPQLRAEPEGVIDSALRSISLWNEDQPLCVLTYYATHPQSYYLRGVANPDFPGIARFLRQVTLNGLPHIHFNGAGGNIGAGKYNDGSPENRQVLAMRMATAMSQAWQSTERTPLSASDVAWRTVKSALPVARHLDEPSLRRAIADTSQTLAARREAARNLAWHQRCQNGDMLDVASLTLGPATILHLPGEAVVEYQLFAQAAMPEQFVAVTAYGDYGTGYICLEKHYDQGGYEASPRASRVSPKVEEVLKQAIRQVMTRETD